MFFCANKYVKNSLDIRKRSKVNVIISTNVFNGILRVEIKFSCDFIVVTLD